MSNCLHCSSPAPSNHDFCCRGCESVYELIHQGGLGVFYELKGKDSLSPLRERPFQQRDWKWLQDTVDRALGDGDPDKPLDIKLGLSGMSCMACVWLVETVAKKQEGIIETIADNTHGSLEVTLIPAKANLCDFADELHKLGYDILPNKLGTQGTSSGLVIRLGICGALAMNTMAFTLPRYTGMETSDDLSGLLTLIAIASSTLALLIGGSYFFKRSWQALKTGGVHMDLPISLGLILAYIGSLIGWAASHEQLFYFDFVAIFTFLMLLGKQIQITSLNRAKNRFQTDNTIPEHYTDTDNELIPTENIPKHTRLIIPPGVVVPADSRLIAKSADLSLAWITGEPTSKIYHHTDAIPAGAINQTSTAITVETTKATSADSGISKLCQLTPDDQSSEDRKFQQKAIQTYLLAILFIGILASGSWMVFTGDWIKSLQVLISIYVVSCPCGIGLALPLLNNRSSRVAHDQGIFPIADDFWEAVGKVSKVIFDKTGTLTPDKPTLKSTYALEALSQEDQQAVYTLSRASLHPLSRSLFSSMITEGMIHPDMPGRLEEIPGKCITLHAASGDLYSLGRPSEEQVSKNDLSCSLTKNGEDIAIFTFEESARASAPTSIGKIDQMLPHKPVILSGDSESRVAKLAQELNIEEYYGSLLPHEKEAAVAAIERTDHSLYLGDGINDLPAMRIATLSGAPFANINMLTANVDFLFTDETMSFLPKLILLSRWRNRLKKQLIAYTLLYNAVVLGFCISGLMSPLIAAIIMPLSSILSILIVTRNNPNKQSFACIAN
ncbi:Cu2+-exporting ATPase [Rubritalea squalenifaciens DSM 18772]|uniref:Cu2+-exporting ATPase n=1 Tax=Rubritalea squalenifaciens DSM 18772 TaxID=1123071 RepID=A0A1M6PRY7_9BACT|nr:heavy metal translocating P-type ATPase metal-binding domain-containing protein [Rubritalea squalenifaciens]SHK10734.1 Cu2+-exporting ATPase [Rubritalea squalenifaciens DSM 18772]